jgi:hypothetical protein
MASADGFFYMYDVNTQEGGVCKLLTQACIYTPNSTLFTANNNIGKEIVNNNFNTVSDDSNYHHSLQQQHQHHHHYQQQQQQNLNYNSQQQQAYDSNSEQLNEPGSS